MINIVYEAKPKLRYNFEISAFILLIELIDRTDKNLNQYVAYRMPLRANSLKHKLNVFITYHD